MHVLLITTSWRRRAHALARTHTLISAAQLIPNHIVNFNMSTQLVAPTDAPTTKSRMRYVLLGATPSQPVVHKAVPE